MAKTNFKSVDEYIASQPKAARGVLKRVRSTIRKAVPSAAEVISYQIPTYKLNGRAVLYFAGWRRHFSLYPANDQVVAAFKDASGGSRADRPYASRQVRCALWRPRLDRGLRRAS